ncbi:MAG: Rrf2 family transcriptional regulator [Nitrospirae bacterium]|nr:Rrf2 family transcriptional regulator [Nitrospirota bacterium]
MQLTLHTDYSIRVLIYLGLNPERLVTISEIADAYSISRNHLVKVVHGLGKRGYVSTFRGQHGGLRLASPPAQISLGEVVRRTETFNLVECFDKETDTCPITAACIIKGVLGHAQESFLKVLDGYTLADVLKNDKRLSPLLNIV